MSRDQQDQLSDHEKIVRLRADLSDFIQKVESAFPRDEGGLPDYSAHRAIHRSQIDKANDVKLAKASIIKNIISWALIGILTVIGSTLAQSYFAPTLLK